MVLDKIGRWLIEGWETYEQEKHTLSELKKISFLIFAAIRLWPSLRRRSH